MSVLCKKCGKPIPESIAYVNNGLCTECYQKWVIELESPGVVNMPKGGKEGYDH